MGAAGSGFSLVWRVKSYFSLSAVVVWWRARRASFGRCVPADRGRSDRLSASAWQTLERSARATTLVRIAAAAS
jgi:hypothetical protein